MEMEVIADNSGMNLVRNMGFQMKILAGSLKFDDNYPLGGYEVDASGYFPKGFVFMMFNPVSAGYTFEFIPASVVGDPGKVKVYECGGAGQPMKEVDENADLSSVGAIFLGFGY